MEFLKNLLSKKEIAELKATIQSREIKAVEYKMALDESRALNSFLKKEIETIKKDNELLANENADVITLNLELQDKNTELTTSNDDKQGAIQNLAQDYSNLEAARLTDYTLLSDLEDQVRVLKKRLARKKKSKK